MTVSSSNSNKNGLALLENGLDAFVARAVLAELAETSLDIQYYLYHQDQVGKLLTGYLLKAANRGVRLRILVDDMDMDGRDAQLLTLNSHKNIQVRLFNPFARNAPRILQMISKFGSLTRRMHNKAFTVDNQMTILGGRNIGNEYFDADPDLEFADLDVLAVGPIARQVTASFDDYWNSPLAYPVENIINNDSESADVSRMYDQLMSFMQEQQPSAYMTSLRNSDLASRLKDNQFTFIPADAHVVVDAPDKLLNSREANDLHLVTQLLPYFQNIRQEILIVSPYFVPGKEGLEFFGKLREKGIRVRILTNSLASSDVGIVHAGYAKYRKKMLQLGVELYEMNKQLSRQQRKQKKVAHNASKASLHAKTFIIDQTTVFIGSLNLDPRSFYENTEIGLLFKQPQLAGQMTVMLDELIEENAFKLTLQSDSHGGKDIIWQGQEHGQKVIYKTDPHTSLWRRLMVHLLSFLPIESQL